MPGGGDPTLPGPGQSGPGGVPGGPPGGGVPGGPGAGGVNPTMNLGTPVRKRVGTSSVIEIPAKLTAGSLDVNRDVVVVRYKKEVVALPIVKTIRQGGKLQVPNVSATDAGKDGVTITVERMPQPGFYSGGEKISNTVTLK